MMCLLRRTDTVAEPKEVAMRIVVLAILAIAMMSATGEARAQTFDPAFPVCMHIGLWGGDREDCSYHTLPECRASAAGRGGVCSPNPYYAGSTASRERRDRPLRRIN
jgi:hypothetical protein